MPFQQTLEGEHLPAEFRKRLTEWEIAKALAGKSQQNVEQLQKHLPSEFNKKYEEWRLKMKTAEVKGGHSAPAQGQVRGERRKGKGREDGAKRKPRGVSYPGTVLAVSFRESRHSWIATMQIPSYSS